MTTRGHLLSTVRRIRESGRIALCGYFLVGFPSPERFYQLVRAAGQLDVMEFGIPSPTPWLDGPVIARAHDVAVRQRGLDPETALALVGGLRDLTAPRIVMTYAADGRGHHGFLRSCVSHGIHGVFAPDLDAKEARDVAFLAHAMDLAFVRFVDPTMTWQDIDEAAATSDILYVRTAAGPTGGLATLDAGSCQWLGALAKRARKLNAEVVLAGGIGIRTSQQVAALGALGFDMAIVGTALIEQSELGVDSMSAKVEELRRGTSIGGSAQARGREGILQRVP